MIWPSNRLETAGFEHQWLHKRTIGLKKGAKLNVISAIRMVPYHPSDI